MLQKCFDNYICILSLLGKALEKDIRWAERQPDGGVGENMAIYKAGEGLNDVYGEWIPRSVVCEYPTKPYLRLRGLCTDSIIDTLYYPMHVKNSQSASFPWNGNFSVDLLFVGEYATQIYYDKSHTNPTWTISGTWGKYGKSDDVHGVSASPFASYVLGRHTWNITNEKRVCSNGVPWVRELKLTGCDEGQFTCDSGNCVMMEQRCDQVVQCRDESDESNCQILVLKESYNKRIPPITTVSATDFTVVPVQVDISIDLLKVVKIEEEDNKIDFQFEITLQWMDIRLTYHNLKTKTSLNALSDEDIKSLWLPLVIYDNTDQKELTRLGTSWEWNTPVSVIRDGNFTRSGLDDVDEKEIFRGDENRLQMQQVYTLQFQCLYDLQNYPFDTQVCAYITYYIKKEVVKVKNKIINSCCCYFCLGFLDGSCVQVGFAIVFIITICPTLGK